MSAPKVNISDPEFLALDRRYLMCIEQKHYWEEERKNCLKEMERLMGESQVAELPGGVFYSKVSKMRPGYTVKPMMISFLQRSGPKPDEFTKRAEESF